MAKIALVSDVHLGTRQYGLKERYEDFIASFRSIGDRIVDMKPDAFVIGGDLFDSPRPDARSVYEAKRVVEKVSRAGVEVYGIDGNHDLADGYWLATIGAEEVLPYEATEIGSSGVTMCGIHYRNGRDMIEKIEDMIDKGVRADILVAHFALAEMNGGGSADTGVQELSPLLDQLGVKAVLMGHVHIPQCNRWNGVLYVNPGSTEMKAANEPAEKYMFVLDTDTWTAEPIKIRTRRVEAIDVSTEDELCAFKDRISEEFAKGVSADDRTFYQIVASDSIDDVFARLVKCVRETSTLARIVVRSIKAQDLAPVVDRTEGVATLESAIEARFPKGSDEAKLTATFLNAPEPAAIHVAVERFMRS